MTDNPEPAPKARRPRKTRAQREAERQAEAAANAAKPIDPLIWIILGALILFVAFWMWIDPVTLANAGYNPSIFQLIPVFLIRIFGQTPATLFVTVLGVIPLVWGIVGWLRKRMSNQA